MTSTIATDINRAWICAELAEAAHDLHALGAEAGGRAKSPPVPSLGLVYDEIAAAAERHANAVELIAIRYGSGAPKSSGGGSLLDRLRTRVSELGSSPTSLLGGDLAAWSGSICRHAAWATALAGLGDEESAHELSKVLAEEEVHRDMLQRALIELIAHGVREGAPPETIPPAAAATPRKAARGDPPALPG